MSLNEKNIILNQLYIVVSFLKWRTKSYWIWGLIVSRHVSWIKIKDKRWVDLIKMSKDLGLNQTWDACALWVLTLVSHKKKSNATHLGLWLLVGFQSSISVITSIFFLVEEIVFSFIWSRHSLMLTICRKWERDGGNNLVKSIRCFCQITPPLRQVNTIAFS